MEKGSGYVTTHDGTRLYFERIGDGPEAAIFPNGIYLQDAFRPFAVKRSLVFYDLRNRGRSDAVGDASRRKSAILKDVADLEAVRSHFSFPQISAVGHSYMGLMVALYAMTFPGNVNRVAQLSPMEPHPGKAYPPHLKWSDGVMADVFGRITKLREQQSSLDAQALCEKFWELLRAIYVFDPVHAEKIQWGRCDLPNERGFMKYWSEDIFPSIQSLNLAPTDFARATAPTLIVHGTKDRSAAYGGARDWAMSLPNARLITLEDVSHAPWIEAADEVSLAMERFLDGQWPESAELVQSLEPMRRTT
jgi:pimeloyl-ACP methyl ester carboxylesterase